MMGYARRTAPWMLAAAASILMAAVLLGWAYHWLGDDKYGGVATINQTINRQMNDHVSEITARREVSQTFVASDDDLTEVQVFLANFGKRYITSELEISISRGDGRVLASRTADRTTIFDNAWYPLNFEPIQGSSGQTFEVSITSPDGEPGNAYTAWIGNCDCYPEGELFVDGSERPEQELVLRVAYTHENVATWRELLDRMSQYKPPIFKGVGLVLLAGLAGVAAMLAFALFARTTATPEKRAVELYGSPPMIAVAAAIAVAVVLITGTYEWI